MERKRILYIAPHFSTGGLPQYLLKKIEAFDDSSEVYCVEYSYYGDAYVVQRNKVINILGDRFIPLGDDKNRLVDLIDSINPDIVHFEEISETFVDSRVLRKIYTEDRKYHICETCHSSQIEPSIKFFKPDKFIMVSKWIAEKYRLLGVPVELLEYPIENKSPDKELAMSSLGLNREKKHVINVGLFTPGKNQGELMRYAKLLESFPIEFHFVGNQASNFSGYWEPLMKDLPSNCTVWGERNDVDLFYQAADLFVFTSKFELNPLCVKESLSWKLPIMMKNLDTYANTYYGNSRVHLLGEDETLNTQKILEILGFIKKTIK